MQDGFFSHICTKKNATVKWIFAENSVIFYKFSLYFKVLFSPLYRLEFCELTTKNSALHILWQI